MNVRYSLFYKDMMVLSIMNPLNLNIYTFKIKFYETHSNQKVTILTINNLKLSTQ